MKCSFVHLCWSAIRELSANALSDLLRVSTRHLAPYMFEDGNGNYHNGIEFQLLQVIANLLKMNLHFQTASNVSDICYDVATNVSDICIGIFPTKNILNNSLTSVTYEIDELIWCVPKMGMMPQFLSYLLIVTPTNDSKLLGDLYFINYFVNHVRVLWLQMVRLLGHLFSLLCWSAIRELSAKVLSDPRRVSTRHLVPYMYGDGNGNYYDGIEFQLLQVIANLLNLNLNFQTASNVSDICYDVKTNVSDICIGGIFPTEDILNSSLMSIVYESDDLSWCVLKTEMMPQFLSIMLIATPEVWFSVIFGYGYVCGFLLYLLVQFDLMFGRRNNTDWHHTTWLITLPAVIGISPNFKPVKGTVRIFSVFVLISAFFLFQIVLTRFHEFVHKRIPWHQVSSFNEILDRDFRLIGSQEAYNLLDRSKMIPQHKVESFNMCGDMNICLTQLLNHRNLAIGGSRENILNSPFYSFSEVFCFEGLENIASYPVALYMRKDFHSKEKVNIIVQRLLEAGFFVKWRSDSQSKRKHDEPYMIPLQLPVSHFGAPLVFLIGCGSIMSALACVAENAIYWKLKQPGRKMKIWIYLEQFFDGERHYLKNLPERLKGQCKLSETENQFPYLE